MPGDRQRVRTEPRPFPPFSLRFAGAAVSATANAAAVALRLLTPRWLLVGAGVIARYRRSDGPSARQPVS